MAKTRDPITGNRIRPVRTEPTATPTAGTFETQARRDWANPTAENTKPRGAQTNASGNNRSPPRQEPRARPEGWGDRLG